jgi:hypothetical protein
VEELNKTVIDVLWAEIRTRDLPGTKQQQTYLIWLYSSLIFEDLGHEIHLKFFLVSLSYVYEENTVPCRLMTKYSFVMLSFEWGDISTAIVF